MNKRFFYLLITGIMAEFSMNGQNHGSSQELKFNELQAADCRLVFFDQGRSYWQEKWFLNGERGTVRNTPSGIVFSAGPVRGDDGSHNVLWTRDVFEGDIMIEFDYTRLDDVDCAVNILYILATGIGVPPYSEDITEWSHLRVRPYMSTYYQYMNLLHISYAANLPGGLQNDYVRARRYPVKPGEDFETTLYVSWKNFPNNSFELEIDGQSLQTGWEWVSASQRKGERTNTIEAVVELKHKYNQVITNFLNQ